MTYRQARHLLEEGKRSCSDRKSWNKADPTAGLIWTTVLTGRGCLFFSDCGPWVYKTGSRGERVTATRSGVASIG